MALLHNKATAMSGTQQGDTGSGPLPIYFSHSYRYEDRSLNEKFWREFWNAGFTFTIDPKSKTMSHPYLQSLIKRTPGFAAVITYRPRQEGIKCSPFMLYEYSLAVLARKPKLVFFDARLGSRYFPELDPDLLSFNPDDLDAEPERIAGAIRQFKKRSEPYRRLTAQRKGKFGILLDAAASPYDEELIRSIEKRIEGLNFDPVRVRTGRMDGIRLAVDFDEYDFTIMDVGPGILPGWVHPFVHGRLIPSIKLFHTQQERPVELPDFVQLEMLGKVALDDEPIVFWRDKEELLAKLDLHFARLELLDERPASSSRFRDFEAGLAYFRSAGRAGDKKIFISNESNANKLAVPLIRELRLAGITAFQYIESNTIARGTDWRPKLRAIVEQADLFVPLVTRAYKESEYCREERDIAMRQHENGTMDIIPYFVEDGADAGATLPQGSTLTGLSTDEQVPLIVRELDEFLRTNIAPGREARMEVSAPLDVAFLTVLPEEYEAVLQHIERSSPAPTTSGEATNYPSRIGEIKSGTYAKPYRVVVTFAGEAGPVNAADATRDVLDRWQPDYLILVGVAGGLPQDGLKQGDVVISRAIWNYEYGKILEDYQPRTDNTYPADAGLVNAAAILSTEFPNWWQAIKAVSPAADGRRPDIKVGMVGSGNKVIDDRSNDFFQAVLRKVPKLMAVEMEGSAAALTALRATGRGKAVKFGMIRGISDMPPERSESPARQTQLRDAWKKYAAEAAACVAVRLVQSRWPQPPLGLQR
jgi:nucleoside phosphorylase